jgi:hypothetical protein
LGKAVNHNTNPSVCTPPELAHHVHRPISPPAIAPNPGQDEQEAKQVTQELRLVNVQLQRQLTGDGVEERKQQPTHHHPDHALHGRWPGVKGPPAAVLRKRPLAGWGPRLARLHAAALLKG